MKTKNSTIIKTAVGIAVFSALAFIVSFVFRLPVMFLTFDAKDAIIAIASFIYGPISGIIMALIAALLELVSVSDTGIYGFIMNFASSATFALVASIIYKFKRNFVGSIIGLYSAVAATTAVMMLLNTFVTPYYMGVPQAAVIEMLPTVLLPFNLAKSLMNAAIAMLLYKPIIYSLRRAKLVSFSSGDRSYGFNRRSVITLIIGGITLAVAIVIFVILKSK